MRSVTSALEGRVAALVLDRLRLSDPHDGAVRGGVEAQDDPLAAPAMGDPGDRLVPDVADVAAHVRRGEEVVVACRDGNLPGTCQRLPPPSLLPAAAGVEREPVERPALTRRGLTGPEHV